MEIQIPDCVRELIDVLSITEKQYFWYLFNNDSTYKARTVSELSNINNIIDKKDIYMKIFSELTLKVVDLHYLVYCNIFSVYDTEKCKLLVKASSIYNASEVIPVSLTYGDIDFFSYCTLLELATTKLENSNIDSNINDSQNRNLVLVDLGHGTGRGIVASNLVFGSSYFNKIVGIEIVPELYEISKVATKHENIDIQRNNIEAFKHLSCIDINGLGDGNTHIHDTNTKVRDCDIFLSLGDFLTTERSEGEYFDWTNGDIVFANSTCFSFDLMQKISKMAEKMKSGTIFISLTSSLSSSCFKIVYEYTLPMSWGAATCYIHQRLPIAQANNVIQTVKINEILI